jgi:hypothetical protein
MRIDRDRFFLLVAALSVRGCGKSAPGGAAPGVVTVDLPAPTHVEPLRVASETVPEASAPAPDDGSGACGTANDTGAVDCSRIKALKLRGPACEGAENTCELLAQGYAYRPHAAEVAAACLDRLGKRVCDIQARKRCYQEGVEDSCPEPQFEARCQEALFQCAAAHIRPQYSLQQCVQAMSAQKPADRDWAISAMGPSSEGKCELMFTVF